ncbi:MAG: hypothetical protein WCJ87_14630, partial [Burkholderiales bacterium]
GVRLPDPHADGGAQRGSVAGPRVRQAAGTGGSAPDATRGLSRTDVRYYRKADREAAQRIV